MWQSTGEGGGQRDNIRGLKNIEKGRKKRVSLSLRTHTQSASLGLAVSWPTMVSVVVAADGTRKKRGIFKLHLHPNPWPLVVMVAFVAEEKKPRAFKDTEGRRVCVVRVETLGFFLVFSSVVVGCPRTVSWWCEWPRNGKVSPILCTGVNLLACVCVFVCSLPGKKDHFCGSKTELFFA